MDDVPYDFASRVTELLDDSELGVLADQLAAPIWRAAAKEHRSKRKYFAFHIFPDDDDSLKYEITCFGDRPRRIEDLKELDLRFVRFHSISFDYIESNDDDLDGFGCFSSERIAEALHLIGRLSAPPCLYDLGDDLRELSSIKIGSNPYFEAFQNLLAEELSRSELKPESIILGGYSEAMETLLRSRIDDEQLREVSLKGAWPDCFNERLEELVCRPNFRRLKIKNTPWFGADFFKRVVTRWRSLDLPKDYHFKHVIVPTFDDLRDFFARWMTQTESTESYCSRTLCRTQCLCALYTIEHEKHVALIFVEFKKDPFCCKMRMYKMRCSQSP